MILISKEEAMVVREKCPNAHIRRTAQQKSQRHRYWLTEEANALALIAKMRNTTVGKLVKQ